ncbi:MAG TPA: nickel pincer cofactor biosynthesis protein LarC [Clostridiales bacterium]|nr:nickel pincer cofactor biosynthesis protein LarC [Clostridiales bacterium]
MKEQALYLECYSGISGDMTVAALLDLGADEKILLEGLQSLKVDGYQIKLGRRAKNSIDACDFDVILTQTEDHIHGSTHDHEHNHDHNHNHDSTHHPGHDYDHKYHNHAHSDHDHDHNDHDHNDHNHNDHDHNDHDHHDHLHKHHHHSSPALSKSSHPHLVLGHHEHRNLTEINDIIDHSSISARAKQLAKHIFLIIAEAEAKAHAKPLDEVHFHEVGAIDSIVDIVATAICLDNLNITDVIVSELYEGTGQIMCQHGLLPIPVPAVVNISAAHQLRLHITDVKGELVTPTGAAIVAAIKTRDALPKDFQIKKIGLGAGKRNYSGASGILRAMLIEAADTPASSDQVWVLEANVDDCTGEALAFAMELLFQKGAKDVYYTPIFMKKNRPAYLIGVICSKEHIPAMENVLFTHTTTIGIRKSEAARTILPREIQTIMTPYGEARVKVCHYEGHTFYYPEYENVKALALSSGQDYQSIYELIKSLAKANL